MAHSDALIFLTNITWIFFLFLFIYLFFVVFFLPTFYKKFRARVLLKGTNFLGGLLASRNVLVSFIFFIEIFRNFSSVVTAAMKKYFSLVSLNTTFSLDENPSNILESLGTNPLTALNNYKQNLTITSQEANGGVVFTKYNKL